MEERHNGKKAETGATTFEWVNTSVPGATRSKNRKQVRSHITKLQHRRARAGLLAGLQNKDAKPHSTIKAPKVAIKRCSPSSNDKAAVSDEETAVKRSTSYDSTGHIYHVDDEQEVGSQASSTRSVVSLYDGQAPLEVSDSSLSDSPQSSSGSVSSQALSGYFSAASSRADPFNTYPIEYHAVHDKLLHHMLTVFAPRGWPVMKISRDQGIMWERFMTREALVEPALFLVRLLFATGDLIRLNQLNPRVADWLRSLAVNEINAALSDPSRYISDGLILAVGRIALGELLYGDSEAAIAIHRPAWKRMIEMRGGMKELPFPALVKKLMRWSDSVMAMKSNTPILLEEPDQGEQTFGSAESVGVLKEWVPLESKAVPEITVDKHLQLKNWHHRVEHRPNGINRANAW